MTEREIRHYTLVNIPYVLLHKLYVDGELTEYVEEVVRYTLQRDMQKDTPAFCFYSPENWIGYMFNIEKTKDPVYWRRLYYHFNHCHP